MNRSLTLGSLFDGSGGFPLAGLLAGIVPIWSSEIESFAIRVTEKRLPQVQHFGNISGLHGAKLPPVDIITFGSPCQDMSIAGKRTGLSGSRSSLFHEAIRIIREMRCASNGKYPRYIVWENVPGAFSSNGGEDFRCVLEAICSVKDSSISISRPAGKWTKAGEILAESYSLAWRVLDAQYWGVPQRRKRIYLIGSFRSDSAGEILFKPDSVRRYSAQGRKKRKAFARNIGIRSAPRDRESGQNSIGVLTFDARGNGDGRVATPVVGDHNNRITDYTSLLVYNNNSFGGFADGIVRRLTPTECERLQGYPDGWTELPEIKDMTDEEYALFLQVWKTDRETRGVSNKTLPDKKKLVKWYNRLESDTSRYQAIGNSLAIPCALRVIGGIVDYMTGTCKQI